MWVLPLGLLNLQALALLSCNKILGVLHSTINHNYSFTNNFHTNDTMKLLWDLLHKHLFMIVFCYKTLSDITNCIRCVNICFFKPKISKNLLPTTGSS